MSALYKHGPVLLYKQSWTREKRMSGRGPIGKRI